MFILVSNRMTNFTFHNLDLELGQNLRKHRIPLISLACITPVYSNGYSPKEAYQIALSKYQSASDNGGYDQGGYDHGGDDQGGDDQGDDDKGSDDQGGDDQGGDNQGGDDQGDDDQGGDDQGGDDQEGDDQGGDDHGSDGRGDNDENETSETDRQIPSESNELKNTLNSNISRFRCDHKSKQYLPEKSRLV